MTRYVMKVDGMMCQGCAGSVESALRAVEGVREVTVLLDRDRAEVVAEEGVDGDALVEAVAKAGYEGALTD